ncbi:MAG: hypothetical protein HC867_05975 [Bacteroidia bacterium]|nr:hypothetical protein [Bacteroidia bacterium]
MNFVSATTGRENIDDYKGFYKTNPRLSWVLAIALFSLAGIPPTAGFFGKFFLLLAGAGKGNFLLISIAALNMVISLYYYLKVIKVMFMDANENPIETLKAGWSPNDCHGHLCKWYPNHRFSQRSLSVYLFIGKIKFLVTCYL